MWQQSAIKCPDEIYPVDRRLEKISWAMLQNSKTRGREVRETYLGGIDSTVQDEKLTVVTGLACFRRSDVHSVGINVVESGSNWRTRMKRNKEGIPPFPSPPLPTPAPRAVFSCSLFFPRILRAEALRCPPHYHQNHLVLRVRESRDYSRKTTSSKNDLHGVEPPYLLPVLPLSSNIIRVILRNVTVWESYATHLSHDRLRAA